MSRASVSRGRAWCVPSGVCLALLVFLAFVVFLQAVDIDASDVSSVLTASAFDEGDFRRACFRSLLPTTMDAEVATPDGGLERVNAVPPTTVAPSHYCRIALARALVADVVPLPNALLEAQSRS